MSMWLDHFLMVPIDFSHISLLTVFVLLLVLAAEISNGLTDAPCGTSAAVASGLLKSKQAVWFTAVGNFIGLIAAYLLGSAVAHTIGTGVVRPDLISVATIGVAMATSIAWALFAVWIRLPVSKTHSLLAALAGIGFAAGGFHALMPASGNWHDSGWVAVASGVFLAILCGSALSWVLSRIIITLKLHEKIPEIVWRRLQLLTVCGVSTGHGFNDGLKYVGIFTLVLFKSGAISEFQVMPAVILLCAFVMGVGTLLGGWRIHRRLHELVNHPEETVVDPTKKKFLPYMGVSAEFSSTFLIWLSGLYGVPISTNHAVVSAMAGAKSADGKVHMSSVMRIVWGWVMTYAFCFFVAYAIASWLL